jgi:hypothetical protein
MSNSTPPLSTVIVVLIASLAYLAWKLIAVRYSSRAARFHKEVVDFFLDRDHPAGNNK